MMSRLVVAFHPEIEKSKSLARCMPRSATVRTVNEPGQLLAILRRYDPEVVVMPWRQGGGTARQAVEMVNECSPGSRLVLLVTPADAESLAERKGVHRVIVVHDDEFDVDMMRGEVGELLVTGDSVGTVLIVEDSQVNLDLVADVLQSRKYRVLRATTAEEGLEIARETHPDVVLMDIYLPGMNGIDAVRQLKSVPATEPIPVVMLSANGTDSAVSEALDAGAIDFIVKPFSPRNLLAKLALVLDKRELLAHA